MPLEARLAGAIWGHLVGDAVGVPYEFGPAKDPHEVHFGAPGAHHQPPGTWSDDGALMLALLDSLLTKGFDTTDQAKRGLAWYRGTAYTPDGDGRFDVGGATRQAIEAFESGIPAEDAGPHHDRANGNGSLMRILPLALVERDATDAELVTLAHRASRVTHGTTRAQVACALYSILARRLLADTDDRAAALGGAASRLREIYEDPLLVDHLAALDHLEGYTARGGRGSVWDSLWSAWDAFAGAADYRETIGRAVAYGKDTDTTAAIAGGLAGIHWGIGGIPAEWLRGMRGRDLVEPLIDRLTRDEDPIRVNWVDNGAIPGLGGSPGPRMSDALRQARIGGVPFTGRQRTMTTRAKQAITRDPELHSGAAVFTGTRIAVSVLLDYLADGQRIDDFLKHYPTVTRAQAIAAIEEVEKALEATA